MQAMRKFPIGDKAYDLFQHIRKSDTWFPIDLHMIRSYEYLKIFTTFWNQKKPEWDWRILAYGSLNLCGQYSFPFLI